MANFREFNFKEYIYQALDEINFKEPTEVQARLIPTILKGKSVVGQSQTGSGKTHTFLLPIFQNLNAQKDEVQAVITTPSRELAYQIYEAAKQKYSLAWSVLKETALLGETQYHFKKIKEEISSSQNDEYFFNNWEFKTAICDGYTLKFDHKLEEAIGDVISGNVEAFYVDCFKMLSRNFEKILHVLQILLEHDKAFITCNYYISNGHLEKRRKILRAAHTEEEAFKNSQMLRTAPPKIQSFFHMDTYE